MNAPWFRVEGEVVPTGAFAAVSALRGSAGADGSQCRYPIGDVRAPDFQFCDKDAASGSVYCAGHSRLCYHPRG